MTKQYLLAKFKDNYADEFNCHGFYLTTQDRWNKELTLIKKYAKEKEQYPSCSFSVGSNEVIEYDSLDDLLDCFSLIPIDYSTVTTLKQLFEEWQQEENNYLHYYSYGMCPTLSDIAEDYEIPNEEWENNVLSKRNN